ncbi:hypothetical protein DAPPUDRAFT_320025 [Daphnia pulex]|uniref:BED-type domain-containing protein n=1 Tax=Daphnia pulex TaxID=6669 RepID=E9GNL6_DAPPU|nr:hypothetical protein DAPPUDRAFT_320025 [Daphnia pulex]|eukprot:EFX78790.1 hypothetical protein DAPPUDRAFT_320025 [Daphnia pulex]
MAFIPDSKSALATVCTGYTPLLEHFTVPLQAAIAFQQTLDSIGVSEGLLNFGYVFAFHDNMNQNSSDTAEGNPVNEEVVIYFDENVALNISAEEYENPSPDSADNELPGVENEEAGAMRPKTPTGRESKSTIWKYMTLLPSGRIECNICKKAFKYNNSTTSHMTHLKRKHPTMVDFSDSSQSVGVLGLGNSDSQPSVVISKKRKIPYITIVAHFISSKWKCERFALLTRAFVNEHTGENIKRELQSAVEEFNIANIDETPTIVCDQGSNVLFAAKLMRWR